MILVKSAGKIVWYSWRVPICRDQVDLRLSDFGSYLISCCCWLNQNLEVKFWSDSDYHKFSIVSASSVLFLSWWIPRIVAITSDRNSATACSVHSRCIFVLKFWFQKSTKTQFELFNWWLLKLRRFRGGQFFRKWEFFWLTGLVMHHQWFYHWSPLAPCLFFVYHPLNRLCVQDTA